MSTLSITRSYNDGSVLVEADLDNICDDVETFVNTTKISDDNIQDSGITGSTKLLNQSVTAAKLGAAAVTTAKIDDLAVTAAKLAADSVTTAKILDANVTAAKLATDSVTTAKIVDSNVTTAKINDSAVTTAKINDSAVTTAKINDSAVTTAKINNSAVTPAKLSTNYSAVTLNESNTLVNSTTTLVTSFTSYGRPIMFIFWDGSVTSANTNLDFQRSTDGGAYSTVKQDTFHTTNSPYVFNNPISDASATPGSPMIFIDTPAAGSHTYRWIWNSAGAVTFNCSVMVMEI